MRCVDFIFRSYIENMTRSLQTPSGISRKSPRECAYHLATPRARTRAVQRPDPQIIPVFEWGSSYSVRPI